MKHELPWVCEKCGAVLLQENIGHADLANPFGGLCHGKGKRTDRRAPRGFPDEGVLARLRYERDVKDRTLVQIRAALEKWYVKYERMYPHSLAIMDMREILAASPADVKWTQADSERAADEQRAQYLRDHHFPLWSSNERIRSSDDVFASLPDHPADGSRVAFWDEGDGLVKDSDLPTAEDVRGILGAPLPDFDEEVRWLLEAKETNRQVGLHHRSEEWWKRRDALLERLGK